jgi:DNA polymerase
MRTLFLDFESFFGPVDLPDGKKLNLSLKNNKLSMTDYVHHPEFEVLSCAMRWDDEPAAKFYRKDEISAVFAEIDWSNLRVVAHNALFDGYVLWHEYGHVPGKYFCTLAAANAIYQGAVPVGLDSLSKFLELGEKLPDLADFRGLHATDLTEEQWESLARYNNNDVDLNHALFQVLAPGLPAKEHELMDQTIKLFAAPVLRVDRAVAQEALDDAISERDELVAKTGLTKEAISGNISFREALRGRLGWVPQKLNEKGETIDAFAKTDFEFVKLKSHPDEHVRNLVLARQEVKSSLGITRAQRLLDLADYRGGLLPIGLNYAKAHTMRWAGTNKMNPQNFTRGSKLRRSIIAPDGHVLLVVDSSQIECRTLAWLAGQEDLLTQFRDNLDPYSIMASKVFGFEVNKTEHPDERFMGKTMVLGLGYGMGWRKFFNEIITGARGKAMAITPDFAERAVAIYRGTNDKVVILWKTSELFLEYLVYGEKPLDAAEVAKSRGRYFPQGVIELDPTTKRVVFPNGCYLRYPNLINDEGQFKYQVYDKGKLRWKNLWGGSFVENYDQTIARHIVAEQILELSEHYRPVLLVHDESVNLVPEKEAEQALELGMRIFRKNLFWTDIPLDSEGGYDRCYSK